MHVLPYKKITQNTDKSFEKVKSILDKICILPKKFDLQSILNNVLEYKVTGHSFNIVMGGYGFFYGATNLNPLLSGRFSQGSEGKNQLSFTIRPQWTGLILILVLFSIAIWGLTVSIKRNQLEGIITTAVFIVAAYWALMVQFKKSVKKYQAIIDQLA
jgi:NADH:ubiquinone oxidoreductase subunit 3 (subunit A)